jgi:hypothetical protein
MTAISIISMGSVFETRAHSFKTIVLFSGVGLIASLCMMTSGVDITAGFV